MKKTSLLLCLLTLLSISACEDPKEPQPDPSKFKPLLTYANPQELASVPIPFVTFGASSDKIATWEAEYGSSLQTSGDDMRLEYKTFDPKKDNPSRTYIMSKSGLIRSLLSIRRSLILTEDGKKYNEAFLALLKKEGFQKVEGDAKDMAYSKDELQIDVDTENTPAEYCLLTYTKYEKGQKPKPDPNPEGFKSFLQLDAQGYLTVIPLPYFDPKNGNADVAREWEKSYGSTFKSESEGLYTYITNDPKGDNPVRAYKFNRGKPGSSLSVVSLRAKTVLKGDGSFSLNEKFELLLSKNDYKFVTEDKEKQTITYDNGTVNLTVMTLENTPKTGILLIAFTPSTPVALFDFYPDAIDFPFLEMDPSKYTQDNMKAYEAKLNLRDLNTKLSSGQKYVYSSRIDPSTKKLINTNMLSATYDFTKLQPGSAILNGLSVTTASLAFSNLTVLKNAEGTEYMKRNGFEYEGDEAIGGLKLAKYIDKKRNWSCRVIETSVSGSPALIFSFTKRSNQSPDPVDPTAMRFFLPHIDWTAKIEEGSSIWNFELQRGFSPKINTSSTEQKWMFAAIPYKQWPKERNGFYSLGYYSKSKDDNTAASISVGVYSGYKFKINDEDIRKFFVDNGYEFKGDIVQAPFEKRYFYNAKLKTRIDLLWRTGSSINPFITFEPLDKWEEAEESSAAILKRYKRMTQIDER